MSVHSQKKTILYFSPHQDDELLSMGIDICNSINGGHDVHVILCTDGSKSMVRKELANRKGSDKRMGTHICCLTEEEFITARDTEFRESCRALGVEEGNVHILKHRFADQKLTVYNSKKILLQYLNVMGPDCVVCTLDPHLENNWQHRDHKALGYAAAELFNEGFIRELRLFTEPYHSEFFHHKMDFVRGEIRAAIDTATAFVKGKIQKAAEAYSHWEPEAGRYSVGYCDIARAFNTILKNGTSYCHICTCEADFLKPGVSKCRKLIVSMNSDPTGLNIAVKTIDTVYDQSLTPDAIILWLAAADFPNKEKDLPETLVKKAEENGLFIRWYGSDMKTQDKYVWAVYEYPDDVVIAVDDDMLCHDYFTENLYHSYLICQQTSSDVRVCFAPISIAVDFSLYKDDSYKMATYCKEEVSCLKKLQDNCRVLLDDMKKKHNIIMRMAIETRKLKEELKDVKTG